MNLHNQIMNIQIDEETLFYNHGNEGLYIYKLGHRDARHAAAEMSLKQDRILSELMEYARKILCSSQFDELDEYLTKLENKQ